MKEQIIKIDINTDLDIALAHRLMIELSGFACLTISDQTRMATAVSEVCRNSLEFACAGVLTYSISDIRGSLYISAEIKDKGKGIPENELKNIIKGKPVQKTGNRGSGLSYCRKIVDIFEVISDQKGTHIILAQKLPSKCQRLNHNTINIWKEHFASRKPISPYEEIKFRNNQLLAITEELRAKNEALILANEKEKESSESFLSVADNINQIILKADNSLHLTFVNKYWCRYTGFKQEDSMGNDWQNAIYPSDLINLLESKQNAVNKRSGFKTEIRLKRDDDEYVWHYFNAEPINTKRESIVTWIITCTNIDEKKKFAEELENEISLRTEELSKANSELVRSNAELEQFAYVASHDLNEPIRMVSNFSKLLYSRYENNLTSETEEFFKYIREGAERMQALVKDLLDFSRIGKTDSSFSIVDCNEVIEVVKTYLHSAITESNAKITYSTLPKITAIESTMIRLFLNLIENAIKFRSDATPEIHIGAEKKEESWVFFVRDNGIGISPAYFDRIFVIFQRLHGREIYAGTGIGLAICRKIVEYHGGRIWLESTPGEGSTFYFSLTVADMELVQTN